MFVQIAPQPHFGWWTHPQDGQKILERTTGKHSINKIIDPLYTSEGWGSLIRCYSCISLGIFYMLDVYYEGNNICCDPE